MHCRFDSVNCRAMLPWTFHGVLQIVNGGIKLYHLKKKLITSVQQSGAAEPLAPTTKNTALNQDWFYVASNVDSGEFDSGLQHLSVLLTLGVQMSRFTLVLRNCVVVALCRLLASHMRTHAHTHACMHTHATPHTPHIVYFFYVHVLFVFILYCFINYNVWFQLSPFSVSLESH